MGVKRVNQGARHKILVFGNPMLKIDSTPLRIMDRLKKEFPKIEFKEFDPNENLEKEGRDLIIIDTVEGIKKVMLITDIDMLQPYKLYSMHDFDLAHSLKILRKLDYIDSIKIFGVPMKIKEDDAFKQLSLLIAATLS